MSKTLIDIKDQYGREEGFEDWTDFLISRNDNSFAMETAVNEIALRYFEANKKPYAEACCKATQQNAAIPFIGDLVACDKILDPSNIVLL